MMYAVLEPVRIKKQGQEIELKAGQTIILTEDKAIKLLEQGRIRPVNQNEPIPFDTLKTLYLDAFNRIGWRYGLMARQRLHRQRIGLTMYGLRQWKAIQALMTLKEPLQDGKGLYQVLSMDRILAELKKLIYALSRYLVLAGKSLGLM